MAVKDNVAVNPGARTEHGAEHPGLFLFGVTPRFDLGSEVSLFPFVFNKTEPPAVPLLPGTSSLWGVVRPCHMSAGPSGRRGASWDEDYGHTSQRSSVPKTPLPPDLA